MNKKEIELRLAAIKALLVTDAACDVDALTTEVRTLQTQKGEIEAREKRQKMADELMGGQAPDNKIDKPEERKIMEFNKDTVLATEEYRSGYLKRLQNKDLNEVEVRALTTAGGSAGSAVPTATLNLIIDKLRQTSVLFSKITVSYVPGNLSLVVANAKNAAAWKVQGVDGTPADDTVGTVSLTGYELIKLVEISAATEVMTISAFEGYIVAELSRQMAIAIENAILNGAGTTQPTGILTGVTFDATNSATYNKINGIGYDDFVGGRALIGTMYRPNAIWMMNSKAEAMFMKVKDLQGKPIFTSEPQNGFNGKILGANYLVDDYMADDTLVYGDPSYYYMNFSKGIEILCDRSVGFKAGKITYRGLAVIDGKPALSEAFVKLTRSLT